MCDNRLGACGPVCMLAAVMVMTGCGTDTVIDQTSAPSDESVTPQEVLVRFRNFAESEAVDVEFYATNEPIEVLPDDLFRETNRVTASIGIAGTGIVTPRRTDSITLSMHRAPHAGDDRRELFGQRDRRGSRCRHHAVGPGRPAGTLRAAGHVRVHAGLRWLRNACEGGRLGRSPIRSLSCHVNLEQ